MTKIEERLKELETAIPQNTTYSSTHDGLNYEVVACNTFPKLIQALREAVGALSEIGKPITLDNSILNRPMDNMSTATETLTRIEALLTEGK